MLPPKLLSCFCSAAEPAMSRLLACSCTEELSFRASREERSSVETASALTLPEVHDAQRKGVVLFDLRVDRTSPEQSREEGQRGWESAGV